MKDLDIITPIVEQARAEFPDGGMKVIDCPKCTSKLTVLVNSAPNRRSAGICQSGDCLHWKRI